MLDKNLTTKIPKKTKKNIHHEAHEEYEGEYIKKLSHHEVHEDNEEKYIIKILLFAAFVPFVVEYMMLFTESLLTTKYTKITKKKHIK